MCKRLIGVAVTAVVILTIHPTPASAPPAPELGLPPTTYRLAQMGSSRDVSRLGTAMEVPSTLGFTPQYPDLSHLTGRSASRDSHSQSLPSSWDWRAEGKVTPVKDQGNCGSCYAFAATADFESRLLMAGEPATDFSENNAKECNWYELSGFHWPSGDPAGSCDGGGLVMLANLFTKKGTVLESCDPYVPSDVECNTSCPYQKTLLDWRVISGDSIPSADILKQYIYDNGPIHTLLYVDPNREWQSYDGSYTINYSTPHEVGINHDVLIVGWNDSLPPVQGSTSPADGWIVKNSWGTNWGDNGHFYITYGSANIGWYSWFTHAWQDYDPNEALWYYDEAGWSYSMGCGNPTAWGLVRFTPVSDTVVTRVEFWTTDATSDIDIGIYDNFDGTAPSGLLRESLDHSYGEAGYHSVELDPPLAVTEGDDVVVALKVANASHPSPVAADGFGPQETNRTYMSCSGTAYSWFEMQYDVAFRLRTNAALVLAPDVSITKTVNDPDLTPGDLVTFTLSIRNHGSDVAAYPVVTDTIPTQVLSPVFSSTLELTPTGTLPFSWQLEPLEADESGTITIRGQIAPSLPSDFAFANIAVISDVADTTAGNNMSAVIVGGHRIHLPVIMRGNP